KLFRSVPIDRKSGHSSANGKRGLLGFHRQALSDTRHHTRSDLRTSLRKDQRKLIAAVTRRRIYRSGVAADDFAQSDQRPAANQVPDLIVNHLETIHIQQHHAEWPLGAPRTVQLTF